jgi:hypothetical protein
MLMVMIVWLVDCIFSPRPAFGMRGISRLTHEGRPEGRPSHRSRKRASFPSPLFAQQPFHPIAYVPESRHEADRVLSWRAILVDGA